jgi:hypothetical protein
MQQDLGPGSLLNPKMEKETLNKKMIKRKQPANYPLPFLAKHFDFSLINQSWQNILDILIFMFFFNT